MQIVVFFLKGCGNPALYQLFSTWAHSTERTAFLSFAYGGYSVGALLAFPISSFLCKLGWELAFYVVGGVSLVFGLCCQWLVYSTLEEHPRLSKEEYEYLKSTHVEKSTTGVPWRRVLTSRPVYAFIFTHIFHTYGIMVFTLLIPRFFKEAMRLPLDQLGIWSSAPFFGSFISKGLTITSCSIIEKRPNLNLTRFRRIVYVVCGFGNDYKTLKKLLTSTYLQVIRVPYSSFWELSYPIADSVLWWLCLPCVWVLLQIWDSRALIGLVYCLWPQPLLDSFRALPTVWPLLVDF